MCINVYQSAICNCELNILASVQKWYPLGNEWKISTQPKFCGYDTSKIIVFFFFCYFHWIIFWQDDFSGFFFFLFYFSWHVSVRTIILSWKTLRRMDSWTIVPKKLSQPRMDEQRSVNIEIILVSRSCFIKSIHHLERKTTTNGHES